MGMNYDKINEWILAEDCPSLSHLGKCEAVMAQGNGYLGLRAAMEERYVGETRNLLVNGTFNKFDAEEVTELPNAADVTAVELWIDGQRFHLAEGRVDEYSRELNIRAGELVRDVCWTAPNGKTVRFSFRRVVSLKRLHDIGLKITVKAEREPIELKIRSGIDARVTNTGSQHFSEIEKQFYEKKYIQFVERTTQSNIDFVLNAVHRFERNGNSVELETDVNIERRFIYADYSIALEAGETFTVEKLVNIHTTRDFDVLDLALEKLQEKSLEDLKALEQMGYDALKEESARAWEEDVWERTPITIRGDKDSEFDLFALRYAQYEMRLFLPKHDNRMNIGAKGLSGEGYKGHCFWDTEIFLLPYYMFTDPQADRKSVV